MSLLSLGTSLIYFHGRHLQQATITEEMGRAKRIMLGHKRI